MYSICSLPVELMELILAQLPLPELVLSHSLVCRRWRDIIQKETFLPHRKSYYEYKSGKRTTIDNFNRLVKQQVEVLVDLQGVTIMQQIQSTGISMSIAMLQRCLPWLLNLFSSPDMMKSLHLTTDMFTNLPLHPRYPMCRAILEDRFPHLANSPMSVLIMIICTARNIFDHTRALNLLLHKSSPFTELHIVDMFYLITTYMLVFESLYNLPPRTHYLLQHALSLHHNVWLHDPTDQFIPQTVAGNHQAVTLTAEQRKIVHMDLRSMVGGQDTVRIMAYAGTGKTTTLVEMCKRNPTIKFLLVVFNKSVELHSKRVFPTNVEVRTANSLSYQYITETAGFDKFFHHGLKYTDLINLNILPARKGVYGADKRDRGRGGGFNLYHRAAMIMETLTNFYNSKDEKVELKHSPEEWVVGSKNRELIPVNPPQRQGLVEDAAKLWNILRQKMNSRVKFDHSSSMKEFQLSKPNLRRWAGPHDVLLLDEAQDMNPCMLDVCLNQRCPKIVVGDHHQQIYGFRGAVNALDLVLKSNLTTVKATYYLTQSFRFGAEIAFLANSCLSGLIGAEGPVLVGSSKVDSVTGCPPKGQGMGKIAVLGRTNLSLFKEMVKLVCSPDPHARPKIAFPNDPSTGHGTDPMGWKTLLYLAHFKAGNIGKIPLPTRNSKIYKMSWHEYLAQVNAGNDMEMIGKINIVDAFGAKLPEYIEIIQDRSQYGMHDPDVEIVFSTVHKFKGLEMDTVRLLDDFFYTGIPYAKPLQSRIKVDELNLLYVALTRAKKLLVINDALFYLLTSRFIQYSFEHIEPVMSVYTEACIKCRGVVELRGPVGIVQDSIRVVDMVRRGGWLCDLCAASGVRVINHALGGIDDNKQSWRIPPGYVTDYFHSWLKCVVGPGKGHRVETAIIEEHEAMIINMRNTEVEKWVEPEEDLFPEDDEDFLAIVDEAEAAFDDDDDNLLMAV